MNFNGKCFTLKELEKKKAQGNEVVDLSEEVNKIVTKDETNEFLELMKYSEYNVVEQLEKTRARVSLLSLILSSKPHQQKMLNKMYMPQDINQKIMKPGRHNPGLEISIFHQ